MPVVPCKPLVDAAMAGGYAVAQINTNGGNYDITRAILETAEEMRAPVILGCYTVNAQYQGLDYIGSNLRAIYETYGFTVPCAIHLDHGKTFEEACRAIRAGFTSVMVDTSHHPLTENIRETNRVAAVARACGVTVEAELGQLLTGESDPDSPLLVQVEDVKAFMAEADVDMLAVGIGNSHGFYKGEPKINIQRVREVRAVTDIPLVLHGCTGMQESVIRECISLGMAKINFGTLIRTNYVKYFLEIADKNEHMGHPWRIMQPVKDMLKKDVAWILGLTGSAGKA